MAGLGTFQSFAGLKSLFYAASWSGLAALGGQATAQDAPLGADERDTIVITAQRRPEPPEDVPIFVTALTGSELERLLATNTAGLGKVVPGLVMNRTGPFTQPFLRGVGKRSTLGIENSVATYVDGVYLASSISALVDMRGVDRVEVLYGPQGTLFGRNATGGVIQIVTRDPSSVTSGEAVLQAGTYGYVRADAYLTGGSERVAGNLDVSLSRSGGYGTNFFTGKKDQGDVDHSLVGRTKWVLRPSDAVKMTLSADYQDIDQDFRQLPAEGYPPASQPRIDGFRDGDQDASTRHHFHYGGGSVRTDAALGNVNFMSLTAARRMRARYLSDLDIGPQSLISGDVTAEQDQFSQEFQLLSGDSSPINWVVGLYYIQLEERYAPTLFDYGGSYSQRLGGRLRQTLSDTGEVSSYAAFGQATVPIGKATRLTAGLRYTIERRSVRANAEWLFDTAPFVRPIPGLPLLSEEPFRNSETFREPTWRLSLDHHFSDSLMGYASLSRGFQSGGWNLQTPQNPSFDPEKLDDVEIGLKYLDRSRRFSFDLNAFHYDYSDLQVSAITAIGSTTTNAASAEIYGAGAQVGWRPDAQTYLNVGAQFLRANFNRFPNATCTDYSPDAAVLYLPVSCDVTGNRLPFAPSFKFNMSANRSIDLGKAGSLALSANFTHNSGYFSEPDNVVRQKPFAILDASAQWRPTWRGPSIQLWVRNLTDAHYFDSLVTFPTTGVLQRPAAPRRVGASISYEF